MKLKKLRSLIKSHNYFLLYQAGDFLFKGTGADMFENYANYYLTGIQLEIHYPSGFTYIRFDVLPPEGV